MLAARRIETEGQFIATRTAFSTYVRAIHINIYIYIICRDPQGPPFGCSILGSAGVYGGGGGVIYLDIHIVLGFLYGVVCNYLL